MELLNFQSAASGQIVNRFSEYLADRLLVRINQAVPFYQNLAAITGAGKTVILADVVEQMRQRFAVEPIVLWLSKGKVVVWQTFANLATGKYSEFTGGYEVKPLLDCRAEDVARSDRGLLLVATVGKFNQRDKAEGDRRIFRVQLDVADQSLWDLLKARRDPVGRRRPLIVVYDEGHNLSNQQTQLLMELEPDGIIAASATTRVPEALEGTIERLRRDKGWGDADFITAVPSGEVAESGLVKKHILLGGYVTPMETAIDEMLAEMADADSAAISLGLPFRAKAIYVSSTNTVDGSSVRDDVGRPFREREARPIRIWRHLVENCGVAPSEIAVYCNLKFDAKRPPPEVFNLFSGGDADYERFTSGDYRHIIFNLSLQEGWDDPECGFAYIDKEMGSPEQVTQIVGRVLRQPGAKHYPATILNTAHFYIRTDERGVFEGILTDVQAKLGAEFPPLSLTVRRGTSGGAKPYKSPLKLRHVPTVSIDSEGAQERISRIIASIHDFRDGGVNTVGAGGRIQVLQAVGRGGEQTQEWVELAHSNRVTARWILRREIQALFSSHGDRQRDPINLCDIEHPKFDARIEYNSPAAAHLREKASEIVAAYIDGSTIVQNCDDHPYVVGSVAVDEADTVLFKHALHEGYSGLNGFEREFASALDKTRRIWCRNPSQGGFAIPLLDRGRTKTFNPDFLVWADRTIAAIDTKGDHLISEDSARKLFHLEKVGDGPDLLIRLITQGDWSLEGGVFSKRPASVGYTVWRLKQGKIVPLHCRSVAEAVTLSLQS